jgi:hypothetical protein
MCEIINHKKCLLLNADYAPFCIIDWTKAIIWSLKLEQDDDSYAIEVIDFYKNDFIQGTNKKFPVPAVARTKKFFKINDYRVNFSRKNIFLRDNYTCQYCGEVFDTNKLTYDHVIPKSIWKSDRSSATCWTNITTSCIKCNIKKGNKTPKQAKMPIINAPIKPNKSTKYLPISYHLAKIKDTIPDEWKLYFPESYIG